jgi:uncharacterized protein YndB with AHSA1/START domain
MLAILAYVAIALAIGLVVVLVTAANRPDTFSFQRTLRITAPAERIFPLIANLRTMNTWNPFMQPDPFVKVSYSGPDSGRGAAHTWSGNSKVGEGHIEVIEAETPSRIAMRLVMVKPFKADNAVEFTLAPNGSGTDVTWAMSGRQPFLAKLMTVFIDCDKMVGRQFETGLAQLKTIAER